MSTSIKCAYHVCERAFTPTRRKRYCSGKCANSDYQEKHKAVKKKLDKDRYLLNSSPRQCLVCGAKYFGGKHTCPECQVSASKAAAHRAAAHRAVAICEHKPCSKQYKKTRTQQKFCSPYCAQKAWRSIPKNQRARSEQARTKNFSKALERASGVRGEKKPKIDPAELDKLVALLPDGEFTYREAMRHMNAGRIETVLSIVNKLVICDRVDNLGNGKFRRVEYEK